jgi:hypothetical protein
VLAAACGPGHTSGSDDDRAVLTISPPTSELLILNGVPATEDFTATATYPDGTVTDVTADTHFTIDDTFGNFDHATLAIHAAGKTTAYGTWASHTVGAEVIARLQTIRVTPGVPANAPDLFGGPEDPSHAPTIVYPPDNVVMPRNLGDFEIHWTDASANDVWEVSLHTDFAEVKVYVPGGNGMPAAGPDPSWMAFLAAEWESAVGIEQSVTYQVRGVVSANPTTVGSATPRLVRLSNEEMLGGIYYWASVGSSSPEGIYRHDMSLPGQPAEQFMTKAQTGNRCIACHVLSRDGKNMAITWDGGNDPADMLDVATKAFQGNTQAWNFGTFTPDGTQFLSVHGGQLVVRNYADQSVMATMTSSGGWVTHPDLSPDGTKLVYVRPQVTNVDWSFGNGQIWIRSFDQATLSFGPETMLVGDANNNYYPSFSPDGQWVLFNRSDDNSGNGAYNDTNAQLWVVKADGTGAPVQLSAADTTVGLFNSWGRWAPFAQTLGANQDPMFWITVSSQRNFGVRLINQGRPQIWMTPFFPARAAAGIDPSEASFRLPFQNIDSNNHIAQWTEAVISTQ